MGDKVGEVGEAKLSRETLVGLEGAFGVFPL